MKKIGSILILAIIIFAIPAVASAAAVITKCTLDHDFTGSEYAGEMTCPGKNVDCEFNSDTNDCAMCCIMNTIKNVTDWIFTGVVAISAIMVILGAYQITTAGGNAESVTKGKDSIKYAMIGFLIALLASIIPTMIQNLLSLGS